MLSRFREVEQKVLILEKRPSGSEPRSYSPDLSDENRPEGLLTDGKHKTLINYVSITEFDKICRQQSDKLAKMDELIRELFVITNSNITKDDLEMLTAHKVSKDEVAQIIPSPEAQEMRIKSLVEESVEEM
jgi:hypothetical protein